MKIYINTALIASYGSGMIMVGANSQKEADQLYLDWLRAEYYRHGQNPGNLPAFADKWVYRTEGHFSQGGWRPLSGCLYTRNEPSVIEQVIYIE